MLLRRQSNVNTSSVAVGKGYLGIEERFDGLAKEVFCTCIESESEPPCHQVDRTTVFRQKGNHFGNMVLEDV